METDCTYIPYSSTQSFSGLVQDYINQADSLKPFYEFAPNIDGVKLAIEARKNYPVDRQKLVTVLKEQYQKLEDQKQVNTNINALLNENTFTICTAHQPNLMTGYLYFFYKILHAIKMAEELGTLYPNNHFVPVYYMGSEDNDLDELGQFWYDAQKYKWQADTQTGAVGRMSTKSLKPLLEELFKRLGPPSNYCSELIETLSNAYLQHPTIASATQYLVHALFGHLGLVVLDPDNALLKATFSAIMSDDLMHQNAYPIAKAQSDKLAEKYKAQAFPRPINLFYLKDNLRARIEKNGDIWEVVNADLKFNEQQIQAELAQQPERFSPNVILRGLYQETILPNVCFIGGGAELAYWLQLRPLFVHYKVFYPQVMLRQSVQIIDAKTWKLIDDLKLNWKDIFLPQQAIENLWMLQNRNDGKAFEEEVLLLEQVMDSIKQKAYEADKTLAQATLAANTKMRKQIDVLEHKIFKAHKRKAAINMNKIAKLKQAVAPNGGLQERVENFLTYYPISGFSLFQFIKESIRPFDNKFMIIHPQNESK